MEPPGSRFGQWTVLGDAGFTARYNRKQLLLARCDCGTERVVLEASLRAGTSSGCGCARTRRLADRARKHGFTSSLPGTPEHATYLCWENIIQRCRNPKNTNYPRYGGRGIRVCERWLSFEAFLADVGLRPSPELSIERINNDGHYEPGNCKWATHAEQQKNRRPAHRWKQREKRV